jgi:hypothetical protein
MGELQCKSGMVYFIPDFVFINNSDRLKNPVPANPKNLNAIEQTIPINKYLIGKRVLKSYKYSGAGRNDT